MRHFKKFGKTSVWLSTGQYLTFQEVDGNESVLSTNRADIIRELEACMRDGRGGIENISQVEYDALLQKKTSLPQQPKPWRDELANQKWHRPEGERPLSEAPHVAAGRETVEKIGPKKEPAPADFADIPRPTASK